MESRSFYNTILTEHNLHPLHKQVLKDANLALEGVNPSCGDDIVLQLKVEDGKITDGAFAGSGCAVSQASADVMLPSHPFRKYRLQRFPIPDEATPEEIDRLEEASSLQDISHMPARVKCAVLGWHTMEEMLNDK